MKIYSCPAEITYNPDYSNYDAKREAAREKKHTDELRSFLVAQGYNGTNTGEIIKFHVADGYAQYMVAEAGRTFCLIHLPYVDGYQFPYANRLTKSDVLKQIKADRAMAAAFAAARAK